MSTQTHPDLFAAADAFRQAALAFKAAQAELDALPVAATGRAKAPSKDYTDAMSRVLGAAFEPSGERVRTAEIYSPITGTFTAEIVPELPRVARFEQLPNGKVAVTVDDYNAAKAGSASFRDGVLALYEVIRTQVHGELATQLARTVAQVTKGGDQ